jgi:hypothetical protein
VLPDCRRTRARFAQVGEWLKPTDCKSVPPSEVRRFESFPVHQDLSEPIISSVGRVRRLGGVVVGDDQRSEDSIGDAGDFGDVRGENVAASQRRDARGRGAQGERKRADVAQLVEHSLGKGEVTSSILVIGSRDWFLVET